jgi:hypothetical protein
MKVVVGGAEKREYRLREAAWSHKSDSLEGGNSRLQFRSSPENLVFGLGSVMVHAEELESPSWVPLHLDVFIAGRKPVSVRTIHSGP